MDRSLVEMKRSRSGTASSRRIGTTFRKQTTQPHNGTVVGVLHWRNIEMSAGGDGAREPYESRVGAVGWSAHYVPSLSVSRPDGTGLHAAQMPAADVTRNRPSQRPFVNNATNTHARQGVQ
jgi:hypothetical protein